MESRRTVFLSASKRYKPTKHRTSFMIRLYISQLFVIAPYTFNYPPPPAWSSDIIWPWSINIWHAKYLHYSSLCASDCGANWCYLQCICKSLWRGRCWGFPGTSCFFLYLHRWATYSWSQLGYQFGSERSKQLAGPASGCGLIANYIQDINRWLHILWRRALLQR